MAKNLWNNIKRNWTNLESDIRRQNAMYAAQKVKADLTSVTSGYDTDFPFHIVEDSDDSLKLIVEVTPGVTFTRETDGAKIEAHQLFTWLDKGTAVSHVKFINQDNDRQPKALASKQFNYPGLEAKNWTETIAAKHAKLYPKAIASVIKTFLGGS